MSLSEEEQNRLVEIETLTVAEDPRFVDRLNLDDAVRRRHLRVVCWWLLGLGAAPRGRRRRRRRRD